ncbi:hypothetical protein SAMN04488023_10797 [Pedobacter rhizosphaerae]|uniref:Uncharacterized protein n=1 Tax=Pedobacter rhizosphaerae TaxID=390241 RepID=A0A1H9N8L1_9SPHI|nr:hypothetical protein SAMN04488023_10797 [Pedobacter rhizosphaerae]
MKIILFFLLLLFSFYPFRVSSQGTASGCLIPGTKTVYTVQESTLINEVIKLLLGGNPSYRSNSGVSLSPNYCSWTPSPSGAYNCGVCTEYSYNVLGLLTGCVSGKLLQGYVGNYTMVLCDLDDHSWALGLAAGALGLFVIRRKKLL